MHLVVQKSKVVLGTYQHYKGNIYKVLGVGKHSETLEEVVIYQGQYDSEEFGNNPIWVRPISSFTSLVNTNGKEIPRFKFIK